jgi:hypothetical protein
MNYDHDSLKELFDQIEETVGRCWASSIYSMADARKFENASDDDYFHVMFRRRWASPFASAWSSTVPRPPAITAPIPNLTAPVRFESPVSISSSVKRAQSKTGLLRLNSWIPGLGRLCSRSVRTPAAQNQAVSFS